MFASANSAFSPIAQKGDATIVCSLQSLSLQMPRARARDRIPSPWPASARAERRASAVKPIRFKQPVRKAAPTAGGIKKTRMAQRPLRKAFPTAGGVMRNGIEIPDQDGRFVDDDLPPIVVEWSWRDAMTPPPAPPSPTYDYESCMTGYVTPINQPFEC
jgi:hypothetical protein